MKTKMVSGFDRDYKEGLQDWLKQQSWTHFITIEPSPSLPVPQEEIERRLRVLEFELNKTYLKRSFPRWEDENRFWMIGFREGDGISHQKHYHILLYSPSVLHKKSWYANVSADLQMEWLMLPSYHPNTGKRLEFPPLNIQSVKDVSASSIYSSKWVKRIDDGESWFFPTPPNKTKVAA